MYKIKEVAQLAGVSVRTLHHYDDIGLLTPTTVQENGYRLYGEENLLRLQQILFFKELNFSLQEIKEILDNPLFDKEEALLTHKQLLLEKKHRLDKMIVSIDQTLHSLKGGKEMSKEEMFEPFDMATIEEHQKKYAEEAKRKYGSTDAYNESMKRTASYKENDWKQIQEQMDEIYKGIVQVMHKGVASPEVQHYVGEWRAYITKNFYECTPEIFRGLGEMYVSDERFTKNIDKYGAGLAEFLRDAIYIYCDEVQKSI